MRLSIVAKTLEEEPEVTFAARGSSMRPIINNGDTVTVASIKSATKIGVGDVVLAKLGNAFYLHKVSAVENDRFQISNNRGHVNGWTSRKNILGKLKK